MIDAFEQCTLLECIIIPNTVEEIKRRAFYYCPQLTTKVLRAFSECTPLLQCIVIIPPGVKEIDNTAFNCCPNLTNVESHGQIEDVSYKAMLH